MTKLDAPAPPAPNVPPTRTLREQDQQRFGRHADLMRQVIIPRLRQMLDGEPPSDALVERVFLVQSRMLRVVQDRLSDEMLALIVEASLGLDKPD